MLTLEHYLPDLMLKKVKVHQVWIITVYIYLLVCVFSAYITIHAISGLPA